MATLYKVGFLQTHPDFGQVESNLVAIEKSFQNVNADLMVLPELFNTGYQFKNIEEAKAISEVIPEGQTTQFLVKLAQKTQTAIIAGIAEIENGTLFNSAVIISSQGYLGKYRKAHIFDTERKFFKQGDMPLKTFQLGHANVGVMICFDWRFPEVSRTLALHGADIIAHPSNLVLPHCPQSMITRCLENRVYAVTADRIGSESRIAGESLTFIGQSQIVDPNGEVLYRASQDQEEIKVIEIDLDLAREKKINSHNDLLKDRREDLYRT